MPSSTLHLATPAPSGTSYPTFTLSATGSATNGRVLGPVTSGGEQLYVAKNLFYNPSVGWASDSSAGNAGMIALEGSSYPYPIAFYVSPAGANPRSLKAAMQFDVAGNVLVNGGGNVGIGTTSPQYLLSVNGTIGAKDVLVTNTGWADYVFHPSYRLKPLSEVRDYIRANRHLPDMPSEAEVARQGVSLSEMQVKLLAKIEELTLHMIAAEEQNRELRERMAQLEKGRPER